MNTKHDSSTIEMSKERKPTEAANRGRPKGMAGVLPEGTLGPLETEVMQAVWHSGEATTTRDVHERLHRRQDVAYTTVMTVMGNLTRKGLLERRLEGKAYVYRAVVTQQELTHSRVVELMSTLLDRFAEPAVSSFINKLDTIDEAKLAELEAQVARLRRKRLQAEPSTGQRSEEEGQ